MVLQLRAKMIRWSFFSIFPSTYLDNEWTFPSTLFANSMHPGGTHRPRRDLVVDSLTFLQIIIAFGIACHKEIKYHCRC